MWSVIREQASEKATRAVAFLRLAKETIAILNIAIYAYYACVKALFN